MRPRATLVLPSPWKQTSGMTAAKVRYAPNECGSFGFSNSKYRRV